jgi:hypothetical protein
MKMWITFTALFATALALALSPKADACGGRLASRRAAYSASTGCQGMAGCQGMMLSTGCQGSVPAVPAKPGAPVQAPAPIYYFGTAPGACADGSCGPAITRFRVFGRFR